MAQDNLQSARISLVHAGLHIEYIMRARDGLIDTRQVCR